jgi:ribokinase
MKTADSGTIVVVGTSNLDLTLKVAHLPQSGETVLGDYSRAGGGKAANQAVAAARMGAEVHLVTRLGDDANGGELRQLLAGDGVHLEAAKTVSGGTTGVALIMVDAAANTMIGVAEGVNRFMDPSDLERCALLRSADSTVIVELGIPAAVVERLCELRKEVGFTLILNPAPYVQPLPDWCWPLIDVVTPNEIEAGMMTGIAVVDEATAIEAALELRARGVKRTAITLGAKGVAFADETGTGVIPAFQVTAVDTTAASDAFNGVLAVALTAEPTFPAALSFANGAAALSVTKSGAQSSLPTRTEVLKFLETERMGTLNV